MTGWTPRGDGYHWDHADGSFIELELDAKRYVLYSDQCAHLASTRRLEDVQERHRELVALLAQEKSA